MSRQRFKAILTYDSNCGPTEQETIYIIENNSTDYRYVFNEHGDFIECIGTDSYCDALSCALSLTNGKGNDWECKLEEISWSQLPNKIKEKGY